MYQLFLTNKCKKSLLKIEKHKKFKKELFDAAVDILLAGETLPKKYKNRKLSGEYEGCFECHIQNDVLLIYFLDKEKCVLYAIAIGTHSELF